MAIIQFFSSSLPRRVLGIFLVLLLCLGCSALVYALTDPLDCRMAEGVSAAGVDIGGKTIREAYTAVGTALEESILSTDLSVHLPEETLTFSPEELGARVSRLRLLLDAYRCGRDADAQNFHIPLLPYLTIGEDAVRARLEAYAAAHDTEFAETTWELQGDAPDLSTDGFDENAPCQTLTVTLGTPACHLDIAQVYGEILACCNKAVSLCAGNDFSVTPEVAPEQLPEIPGAEQLYALYCTEAVSDSLDMETYQFVPGRYGYGFDTAAVQAQLDGAAYGETLSIPLSYTEPEILGDAVYFRDVLGEYQTRHNDNLYRNINLTVMCESLNNHIVQPGEEFSFNGVVGERTKERGYKPAPAYSGDRLVDSYGGGVCQGSTTIYNCVLLADLEVVFRACHGASVGYVPAGLDASVNYLTTDFKFRNNFHFPIKLLAEVSDGYVKMKILGTDEKDYYIKMETGRGEDDIAVYARSYKCKYDKETNELISREIEAFSTYYKDIG